MPRLLALTGTTVHTETLQQTTKQKYNVLKCYHTSIRN